MGKTIVELPDGFLAKVGRAKCHLDTLKSVVAPFSGEGKAYSIAKEFDAKTREFRFFLRVTTPPDITTWSLIVGDCIHNARTALDHLFWGLATKQNPSGVEGNTSSMNFPILKDFGTFNGRKAKLKSWVGEAALAKIEKLQPFNDALGWQRNALSFLHDFDIIDKHKLLLPAVSIADSARISADTVENREIVFDGNLTFSLRQFEDGAELARFVVRNPEDVMDMHIHITFQIIFQGQPGPLNVIMCLQDVIARVEEVGSEFQEFL